MLNTLWNLFFGICCFRLKPQDVPAASELLLLCLLAYAGSSFFFTIIIQSSALALLIASVHTLVLSLFTYLVVSAWRVPQRWYQVTTALAGTGVIFNLVATPPYFFLVNLPEGHSLLVLLFLLVIILMVWNIAVMTHILRHALDASVALGLLVSLIYVLLNTFMVSQLQSVVI